MGEEVMWWDLEGKERDKGKASGIEIGIGRMWI